MSQVAMIAQISGTRAGQCLDMLTSEETRLFVVQLNSCGHANRKLY